MTADERRAAMVEKVARAQYEAFNEGEGIPWDDFTSPEKDLWRKEANAAIDLIRADTLEEAAKRYEEGDDWDVFGAAAAAIRALKGTA